jgi:hypothetical protein
MTKKIRGNAANPNRDVYDFYPTDPLWTKALLDSVKFDKWLWECAAGQGHITDVLEAAGFDVYSSDIQGFRGEDGVDFLELEGPQWDRDIITNPPYALLDDFITQSLKLTDGTVALLANLQAAGGTNRTRSVWTITPPSLILIIPQRMKVNGKASQFCHAWFVWERGLRTLGQTRVEWKDLNATI